MSTHPDEKPEETPAEQPEPEEQAPPETVEPADADDAPLAKVVELHTERGSLTLRPNQKSLDPEQIAALVAIGIDTKRDPQVAPHVRPFIHMCQTKGLDPWAKEAYLIGRGKGDYRKYTMQTGIDGYRKMAASTGRFIRVKEVVWTGADDDDRTWRAVDDGRGGVVMRRVWFDQWPASRGNPGAARVTIEHYDDYGNVVETDAVADWEMYAPYSEKWEGKGNNRRRVTDDQGNTVMELNEMWRKGGPHMLAKCAEALADRKAFPARMSGVYTHEEMHRHDQIERDRIASEQKSARQIAYQQATSGEKAETAPTDLIPANAENEPVAAGDVLPETVAAMAQSTAPSDNPEGAVSEDDRGRFLRGELEYMAEALDRTVAALTTRAVKAARKNVEDFTADELLTVVRGLRPHVLNALRAAESPDAEAYSALGPDDVVDLPIYLGHVHEAETVEEPEAEETVDPDEIHDYRDDDGSCHWCGLPEEVGPHPEG